MRQDWPIFCSYLDRLIQRYSSVELPAHGKRQNQMVKDSLYFLLDYLHDRYSRLPAALSFIL